MNKAVTDSYLIDQIKKVASIHDDALLRDFTNELLSRGFIAISKTYDATMYIDEYLEERKKEGKE